MSHGSLRLRFGPMFSGKTTWLDGELKEFSRNRWSCLKIVHSNDLERINSTGSDILTELNSSGYTHNPNNKGPKNFDVTFVSKLSEIPLDSIQKYNIIGIDEGQFFSDLVEFVKNWVGEKHLLVTGLDGNFAMGKFGSVLDLIPLSDEAIKINAKCDLCIKEMENNGFKGNIMNLSAPFSKRTTKDTEEVLTGGADKYVAACRYHHHDLS
jgi:thymidine kinase